MRTLDLSCGHSHLGPASSTGAAGRLQGDYPTCPHGPRMSWVTGHMEAAMCFAGKESQKPLPSMVLFVPADVSAAVSDP